MIDSDITFGDWLRRQRRALDLTRAELAARAACSVSALRKFEADELRPSRPLAESLAGALQIAPEDRAAFVRLARDTRGANTTRSPVPTTGLQRPAPRSTVRSTLPAPPTALIGREQERAALGHLMRRADVRLLTLTGSGGTGKTRLALQLAADLHDAFRDGVCVVSLAPVTDPNLIAPTIAETLNIYEARGRSVLDTLHGYLRNKQMLLLLDNFEHVLAAAPIVAALLAEAPALKVLSTSRIPLHVRGEQEFAVLPLALPDPKRPPAIDQLARYSAVELFVQRARAVQYDFAVSEENAATVVEICRRLDGLPLAIELAAARSKIFPPRALLDQLGSRLAFLIGGPRDAPARQQTLRATIEWSYALLDAHEQALFGRLAVFGGAFSLQAAAAVCRAAGDLDADVVARVESLVDKSMVRADPTHDEPRFFMLETLREYALERLVASGEAETVRRRHAQFFLTLAEEDAPPFGFAMQAHWLERLEREHDNLRAALRWFMDRQVLDEGLRLGAALGPFWMGREYLTEGRMWLTELLQVAASEPVSAARAKALLGAASLLWGLGDYTAVEQHLEQSMAIGRAVGHAESVSWSQFLLAIITHYRGHFAAAIAYVEEALARWRALGDQDGVASGLAMLGTIRLYQVDITAAGPLLEESLVRFRQLGNTWGIGFALFQLGQVREQQDDLATARAYELESQAIWQALRDPRYIAYTTLELGRFAFAEGDDATACALWQEGLAIATEMQDPWIIGVALGSFVPLAAAQGQAVRALRLAAVFDGLYQRLGGQISVTIQALVERGRTQAMQAVDHDTQMAACAEGQAMTLEQAIAYALDATNDPPIDRTTEDIVEIK